MYNHKKITYLIYPKSVVIWTMIDEIQRLKMHILRIYFINYYRVLLVSGQSMQRYILLYTCMHTGSPSFW